MAALPRGPWQVRVAGVGMLDRERGWAFATGDESSTLYTTSDGGYTWVAISARGNTFAPVNLVTSLIPIDARTVFAGTELGDLFISIDGGAAFNAVSRGPVSDTAYDFVSPDHGWRNAGGRITATRDGGRTWTPVAPGYNANAQAGLGARASFDLTAGRGWIISSDCPPSDCAPNLLSTDDDGQTWTRYDLGSVRPVRVIAADPQHAWILDLEGRWLATADGGETWEQR